MAAPPPQLSEENVGRKNKILRNLQEYLGVDKLDKQLESGKLMHVYWGTATTGKPHIGYFVPMTKIADFLQAGLKVTVLFADLHAFLDNMKSTWELLENRVIYYEHIIKALLESCNVPIDKLHFVRGTTYQLSREFTYDVLRLTGQVSRRDALKAGAEVVKQVASPLLSGLLYPLLQALDEQYLKVDGQFGGVDQRKIFILAEEQLPKLKLGKRWHLMNPMVPGLKGSKMSSSEIDSKIDLLDSEESIKNKILSAACERQEADNGILCFFKNVVVPFRPTLKLGNSEFNSYEEIRDTFLEGKLSEQDLKNGLIEFLGDVLGQIRKKCDNDVVKAATEKGYQELAEVKPTVVEKNEGRCEGSLPDIFSSSFKIVGCANALKTAVAQNRPLNIVFPIHPKGKFHLGFIAGLLKIKALKDAGVNVQASVVVSDIEAFLDQEKVEWNLREARSIYFQSMCEAMIQSIGLEDVKVLLASSFADQFNSDYVLDMYKMASSVTQDETTVCEGTALAGNLVPILYALNVRLTKADAVIVGEDSENIALLAEKLLRSIGSVSPTHLSIPVLSGCDGKKMGCSNLDFILDPLDTPKQTKTKFSRSFCAPGELKDNVAMEYARKIVFPLLQGNPLVIERSEDNGGNVSINNYEELEHEFLVGSNPSFPLHPGDLKGSVLKVIEGIFDKIRGTFKTELFTAAFPSKKGGGKKKN